MFVCVPERQSLYYWGLVYKCCSVLRQTNGWTNAEGSLSLTQTRKHTHTHHYCLWPCCCSRYVMFQPEASIQNFIQQREQHCWGSAVRLSERLKGQKSSLTHQEEEKIKREQLQGQIHPWVDRIIFSFMKLRLSILWSHRTQTDAHELDVWQITTFQEMNTGGAVIAPPEKIRHTRMDLMTKCLCLSVM